MDQYDDGAVCIESQKGTCLKTTFRSQSFREARHEIHFAIIALSALLLLAYADLASAQSSSQQLAGASQTQISNERLLPENLSLSMGLEYAEESAQLEAAAKKSSMSLTVSGALKISESLTSSLESSLNRDSSEGHQVLLSDSILGLSIKGMELTQKLKTVHSVSALIPVAESTIKTERLRTSISAQNGLSWQVHPQFSMAYRLGLTKNFHEFDVNADNRANVEYRLAHRMDLKLNLTDSLYATVLGSYRIGRTYTGFQRFGFQSFLDLNYDLNKNWTMNIGTSNEGAALKPNGVDSNISLFDENTGVIRLGISATL